MNEIEQLVNDAGLPERTTLGLWDAAIGFKVRNGTYREATDVSAQAASRDLNALVEAGFLEPKGEKKGRYYVGTRMIRELWRSMREVGTIADPYAEPKTLIASGSVTATGGPVMFTDRAAPTSSTGQKPPSVRSVSEPEK
jgi:hypothetical protein